MSRESMASKKIEKTTLEHAAQVNVASILFIDKQYTNSMVVQKLSSSEYSSIDSNGQKDPKPYNCEMRSSDIAKVDHGIL
jgi:hypothetical protein